MDMIRCWSCDILFCIKMYLSNILGNSIVIIYKSIYLKILSDNGVS